MRATTRLGFALLFAGVTGSLLFAQTSATPTTPNEKPPAPSEVAATVNGEAISELAVFRALVQEPPKRRAVVRKEVLNFLINNAIVDQYVRKFKIEVDPADIEKQINQLREDAKKEGANFDEVLKRLHLTDKELRQQLTNAIRWEKFAKKHANDKVLKNFFDKNKAIFDGSQVHARHILINVEGDKTDEAKQKLLGLKKQIEGAVAKEMAKVSTGDKLKRESERIKILDKAFADAAHKESACPSKENGGNLGWFPRAGSMVEPFARAAFSLKPYEMSDPVETPFGLHLILTVDRKQGKEVKFDTVRPAVIAVYVDRLRKAIVEKYRPTTKVVINDEK